MRLGSIAAAGDFWRVIREFNPEGIEREATTPLEMWLVGEPGTGKRTLASSLLSGKGAEAGADLFRVLGLEGSQPLPQSWDPDLILLVVRLDGDLAEKGRGMVGLLGGMRCPILLVFTHADGVDSTRDVRNAAYRAFSFISHLRTVFVDARDREEVQAKLVPMMLETAPALRTPLARQLPAARPMVSEQIISETCRVNAQFALAANLPANLPFLGGVAGSVTDLFVLTKNQVMMVFRLAAIYGRDIAPTAQVAAEIAPVIGGAFLWRTIARVAVGVLPTLVAAAPKMAIAYVGTYVVGHAARYYYEEGRRPSPQLMRRFSSEASRLYRRMIAGGNSREPQAENL